MGPSSSSSDSDHQRQAVLSKIATNDGHGEKSPYFDGWKAYDNDPFHPTKNPNGVIQMGLSENLLSVDLIEEWIKRNPNASICTPEGVDKFKDTANFQDYHGLPEFRNAIALFMEKVRGGRVKFDPSRIVMAGGATGATETIAFCLADPGDAFLASTPYYPGFDRDFSWRTGVQLVPVICNSSNKFKVTRAALEVAYKNAQEANIKVKGVLISSPTNPLGRIVDEDTLNTLVSFINEKNIHLVCDEIYSASVFSSSPKTFISISEIIQENPKCNKNLIHILYSLSKDMGLPGFRVGILYSYNDAIVNCARKMSSYGLVSTQTQHLIASMLSDNKFIEMFLEESSRRLSKRYDSFTRGLAKANIGCLESNAGLAFWMDLRKLLKEPTLEAEMKLWKVIINDVKLNISPGSSFHCSEPGWFRVCFANMDDDTMEIALGRIQRFCLGGKEDMDQKAMEKQYWRQNLRLSFKKARLEEFSMAPDMILSPHSPLVSAKT